MKLAISIILLAVFGKFQVITLKKYYNGQGVIFDETAHYPWIERDYVKPYKPSIEDIKKAEKFLSENYYSYEQNILDSFQITKHKISLEFKNPKNVIKKFQKYNRQYAGFINSSKDTIIYIGLLNFANKKKAEEYFDGWKEIIMLGSDGFYDKNQDSFLINQTKTSFVYRIHSK